MKNQKLLAAAALAGLTLGGITITAASAQSYGDEPTEATIETAEPTEQTDTGGIVVVQDTEDPAPTEPEVDGEQRSRRGHGGGCNLEEAAAAIGIDEATLEAAVESGDSIADVAEANGVEVDVVIDAMVDEKADRINDKVTEGRLTQAEADEKLAELEAKITDRVNGSDEAADA